MNIYMQAVGGKATPCASLPRRTATSPTTSGSVLPAVLQVNFRGSTGYGRRNASADELVGANED